MHDGAETATPHAQEILEARALDALLLADLPSHRDTGPDVEDRHELGKSAHHATVAHRFRVLSEHVARAEVGDYAGREVVETAENSIAPLARHVALFVLGAGRERRQRATTLLGVTGGNEKMGEPITYVRTYVRNLPRMRISEHVMRVGDRSYDRSITIRQKFIRTLYFCFRGPGIPVRSRLTVMAGLKRHKVPFQGIDSGYAVNTISVIPSLASQTAVLRNLATTRYSTKRRT